MEEYIYIIGGIAYLAYSFYSASKKKRAQEEAKRSQSHEPESVVEDDFDIEKLFGIEQIKREIQDFPSEIMQVEQEQDYEEQEEVIIDEIKPIEKKYTEKVERQTKVLIEEEEYVEDQERLDLRRAIIYSEILNPPYIQK